MLRELQNHDKPHDGSERMRRVTDSGPKQFSGKTGSDVFHCRAKAPHGAAQQDEYKGIRAARASFVKQNNGHYRIDANGNHVYPEKQGFIHTITEIYIFLRDCTKVHYIVFHKRIQ